MIDADRRQVNDGVLAFESRDELGGRVDVADGVDGDGGGKGWSWAGAGEDCYGKGGVGGKGGQDRGAVITGSLKELSDGKERGKEAKEEGLPRLGSHSWGGSWEADAVGIDDQWMEAMDR